MSLLSLAAAQKLHIGEIVVGDGASLRLLKFETPQDRSRRRWLKVQAALGVVVLALVGANLGVAHWQRQQAYAAVSTQLEDVKARALALRRAQAAAAAQHDSNAALLRERLRSPTLSAVWNALSQALPDTVWLSGLELAGRQGRISGFADSAAPLIEIMESLDLITGVAFASPVTINPDDRLERFDITFSLELASENGSHGQEPARP